MMWSWGTALVTLSVVAIVELMLFWVMVRIIRRIVYRSLFKKLETFEKQINKGANSETHAKQDSTHSHN